MALVCHPTKRVKKLYLYKHLVLPENVLSGLKILFKFCVFSKIPKDISNWLCMTQKKLQITGVNDI